MFVRSRVHTHTTFAYAQQNNPLHIALFPEDGSDLQRDQLEFNFLLSTCLDIFHARTAVKSVGQDLGLLQATDERLATYGWLTNTGVKLVIVVDMEGKIVHHTGKTNAGSAGLRSSDLPPAFRAIQTAYINLLRNPFFDPDELSPAHQSSHNQMASARITSPRFTKEVERIGRAWQPTP